MNSRQKKNRALPHVMGRIDKEKDKQRVEHFSSKCLRVVGTFHICRQFSM